MNDYLVVMIGIYVFITLIPLLGVMMSFMQRRRGKPIHVGIALFGANEVLRLPTYFFATWAFISVANGEKYYQEQVALAAVTLSIYMLWTLILMRLQKRMIAGIPDHVWQAEEDKIMAKIHRLEQLKSANAGHIKSK